jgi:D-serine deaminase-like pyridoxal phosphate-dependent protein
MISLQRPSPNAPLVGKPGGRKQLMTPCLVLDRLALQRNIERMAALCREAGVALRPHAKTHKSVEFARMQVAAGAVGISVASVGEAEVMVEGGIEDVLITSIAAPNKADRLLALARSGAKITVALDNLEGARVLNEKLAAANLRVGVYLDVDMGRQRSGVPDAASAVELAQFLQQSEGFEFRGVQAYAGHASHVERFDQRAAEIEVADRKLDAVCDALKKNNIPVERVSGVSTGSLLIDIARKRFNELQCGSYTVMDVEYNAVALDPGGRRLFEPALFVRTSVISRIIPGRATVDAGHKHFAGIPAPVVVSGAPAGAELRPNSDEHGFLTFPPGAEVQLGDAVECITPHCDPTINLYSHYHVVEGDELVAIWPVDARGAF